MATLSPYLSVKGGLAAIAFYQKAFGAVEVSERYQDGDKIGHADLSIDGAVFSLSDESPEYDSLSPTTLGGAGVHMILTVDDCDAAFARAMAAGGASTRPPKNEPHGRMGVVNDPFGHRWFICGPAT